MKSPLNHRWITIFHSYLKLRLPCTLWQTFSWEETPQRFKDDIQPNFQSESYWQKLMVELLIVSFWTSALSLPNRFYSMATSTIRPVSNHLKLLSSAKKDTPTLLAPVHSALGWLRRHCKTVWARPWEKQRVFADYAGFLVAKKGGWLVMIWWADSWWFYSIPWDFRDLRRTFCLMGFHRDLLGSWLGYE